MNKRTGIPLIKQCFWLLLLLAAWKARGQEIFPLYQQHGIPNSRFSADRESADTTKSGIVILRAVSQPTLTCYPAPDSLATGDAMIVCPGGGYWVLAIDHEGAQVARRLNEMGVSAFVLKYRIPNDEWMLNREIGPLQDAQRAIQLVRENAQKWKVNPSRIGIMGFSAGGHLASTAGTHFRKNYIPNPKKTSLRPDFMVLLYPVITLTDSIAHKGSAEQLLGKNPAPEKMREYSNELQVTPETPPTFLVHARDDFLDYRNSVIFAKALREKGIGAELLLYDEGGHGFGTRNETSDIDWLEKLGEWLTSQRTHDKTNTR